MALKKIPTEEQSLLCASVYINNFKRVIEELVYNSLDSASTSIAIRVCIQENFIQVLDNGNGILKDNFRLLGQRYATNKYVDKTTLKSAPDKYGFKGLALASIIDVSKSVKISSRHETSNETWMKTFFNGKEKEICKSTSRPSKGTTVEIKRFLYNLNIQRKSIDPQSELQNIKIVLQQLSLMHCNVSFSIRDDFKNDIIFQIHKNRSMHETIQYVFQINEKNIQELIVEKKEYKVQAFIGKNTAESNNYYQWIYINGKFIHKSILHRKLNESLSKSLNTNNRNKNKIYEDEKKYFNSNIPFYFIFITCPNIDFDVTYNSEKYLVEFKGGKEIKNLIEKLVKFYNGSLVSNKKEVNKIESAIKKKDTRAEITGIIEKILNNKNKPSRISQLQNGVKGKILKRNRQKKKDLTVKQILNKKIQSIKDPHGSRKDVLQQQQNNLNASKVLELPKDTTDKVLNSYVPKIKKTKKQVVPILEKNFNFGNSLNMLNNSRNNVVSSKIPKKKNTKKHVKTFKKHSVKDSLIKKFEAPTNSMRKRIEYLNQKVLKLLDRNCFKEYSCTQNAVYSFINNETQYQTTPKNTANLSLCENIDKNLKHILASNISGNKNIEYNINEQTIVKTSYDLIKTVMSQYKVTENINPRITHCRQSYERKTSYTYKETCIPMGTFNSHNNNHNNNDEAVKKMGYFISETSRNNFFLHERELFPLLNKNNSKVAKLPRKNHKSSKKISNCNLLNIYDQELKEYSYTIEMTENHETINCRRDTFHSIEYNLQQDDNNAQSLHFGNKYTLEGNMRSSHQNDTYTLNEIYSLQMCNGSKSYCYLNEIQPSIMQKLGDNESNNDQIEKDNLLISESESNTAEMMPRYIEPTQHCKAILDSHSYELRNLEQEFEYSFLHRRDTQTHFDFNINNDLQQTENNVESNQNKNISHSKHSNNVFKNSKELFEHQVDKNIQNVTKNQNLSQELQTLQIDGNKIDNDSIYNFLLKSRHKFMPKGMSPIAKNQCKLQSAYRFNGDEIYFKDMIYKNFANDVLINTEIFEPEVHNVKNIFSKNIEKVNIGIQKQNSDLIFDSLSLMRAKILGQLDRKFIASILNGKSAQNGKPSEFLVLFDQHAVDERIRLENNLSDYIQGNDWKSINIDPISIVLNKDDQLYFVNHNDKLAQFGLQWTFTSENEILIDAIPKAILGKHLREVEIVMKAVKKLISEEIKTIKSLRGNVSLYPKSIMELVFNEACRYAIKFGDKLSKSECTNMIDSLARCKTPFQCAHGRPVMAVLMELKNNSQTYEINLTKVKKFKKMQ